MSAFSDLQVYDESYCKVLIVKELISLFSISTYSSWIFISESVRTFSHKHIKQRKQLRKCQWNLTSLVSIEDGSDINMKRFIWIEAIVLTHQGRVTHICVDKLIIIGSDNGLSPDRRQTIIWTNDWLLSIGPLRTYCSENLIRIQHFSLKKMHVKMASAKWRPTCLRINVLMIAQL